MQLRKAPNQEPPPMSQPEGLHDPYKFIFEPNKTAPKKILPNTNTKRGRILVIVIGLVVAIILVSIVSSLLSKASKKGTQDLIELTQRQQEIIRVAGVGVSKAKSQDARNLAITTQLTLTSDQQLLLARLKKSSVKLNGKILTLRLSPQTDDLLTQANQNNEFDEVFIKTVQTELSDYQRAVKKTYDASTGKTIKNLLNTEYVNASKLIAPPALPAPDPNASTVPAATPSK